MKKFLIIITVLFVLIGCESEKYSRTMQKGVVLSVAMSNEHGYKYYVEVKNINQAGVSYSKYILLTDYNYHVGDTITIK